MLKPMAGKDPRSVVIEPVVGTEQMAVIAALEEAAR